VEKKQALIDVFISDLGKRFEICTHTIEIKSAPFSNKCRWIKYTPNNVQKSFVGTDPK
jgi:hypothetical protein